MLQFQINLECLTIGQPTVQLMEMPHIVLRVVLPTATCKLCQEPPVLPLRPASWPPDTCQRLVECPVPADTLIAAAAGFSKVLSFRASN